jgi:hypothetical protein
MAGVVNDSLASLLGFFGINALLLMAALDRLSSG